MNKCSEQLILFSRYPVAGEAKTRLIPLLGGEGAAELQRRMTEHAAAHARKLALRAGASLQVRFAGGSEAQMKSWLGAAMECRAQGEGDLGARMAEAFRDSFARGFSRVLIVGADCPGLTADVMGRACSALSRCDVALGPAVDGGYYLVGLRRPAPDLFAGIPWGTEEVFAQTVACARRLHLSLHKLETLPDVDRPEDLCFWEEAEAASPARYDGALISVVIPTLNEAPHIAGRIAELREVPNVEVIVADGGSSDGTADAAAAAGARLCRSAPGRARQMNLGAASAQGAILLFLHADSSLPAGFSRMVRDALAQEGVIAGAFRLQIADPNPALRRVERLAHLRSRLFQMPYGDQALFMTAGAFRASGSFPDIPLMEDFELVRRLGRLGRIAILPSPVRTSARRWHRRGVLRQTLLNQFIIVAHLLGASPARLARWYA